MEIKEISIDKIKPDKNQPRKTFDKEILQGLAESILGNGLLNPIEIDSDYTITDGERRWRASKLAGLKTVTCRIVKVKDDTEKLRRQLVYSLQDEEISTDEKYNAIVRYIKILGPKIEKQQVSRELGISNSLLTSAFKYCNFVEKEPEIAKKVSPHIIIETSSLPEKERKEVLKEFEGTKEQDKKKDLIRELVKVKRKEVEDKKRIAELESKNKEADEAKKFEIKVSTTKEILLDIRDGIFKTQNQLNNLMGNIKRIRRTKLYLYNARDKENFLKVLEGSAEKARKWADELDNIRENLELEIVRE